MSRSLSIDQWTLTGLVLLVAVWLPIRQLNAQSEQINTASTSSPTDVPAQRIDLEIQRKLQEAGLSAASQCSDHEFARRLYLDLTGSIPNLEQLDRFLSDTNPAKRARLIEELLASDAHFDYFATIFDTMLMGRKEQKLVERRTHGWHAYLRQVFSDNRPWDEVVQEILLARGKADQRGHLWYLYERENKHQEIAESIAKSFFGVDIACAQCHDHLAAEEIKQAHYWGLVGFFRRSTNTQTENGIAIAESAVGGFDDYANPLLGTTEKLTLSFLLRNDVSEVHPDDPTKQEDREDLYVAIPGEPKVPVFSRREKFVAEIVQDHPLLARAMVNRIWGLLMGRGLVHPIDKMDSTQVPSHPELLDWLADDFRHHNYDIRRLLRAVVSSNAYQQSSDLENTSVPDHLFAKALLKPLTAEAYSRSLEVALSLPDDVIKSDSWRQVTAQWRKMFPEVIATTDQATIDQALALTNSPEFNDVLLVAAESWVAESHELTLDERIELLFRRVVARSPATDEQAAIKSYLESRLDRPATAWAQIFWTMVTSPELRFNH
ncbi:MAG: DUF1553 domain-containing protein [Planctomycetaceae bacterium]|nr:DUF1553 domain-containing protein [Planctomycetaceae bacterium]